MDKMTHEEAKIQGKKLNEEVDKWSKVLNSFERGKMGLTPEHVRVSDEYREATSSFNKAFAELRKFNSWYVKKYMKKKK